MDPRDEIGPERGVNRPVPRDPRHFGKAVVGDLDPEVRLSPLAPAGMAAMLLAMERPAGCSSLTSSTTRCRGAKAFSSRLSISSVTRIFGPDPFPLGARSLHLPVRLGKAPS